MTAIRPLVLLALLLCAGLAHAQPQPDAPPALEVLEQTLVAGDLEARLRAVEWLGADPSPGATAALALAALDAAPEVRRLALAALGPREVEAAVFAAALSDADPLVRVTAVAAATRRDEAERAAVARSAVEDPDARVRTTAVESLARMSRAHWPDCEVLAQAWRDAGQRGELVEREAVAALLEPQVVSASACGLSEDEYRAVRTDALRHARFLQSPELGLAQRGWRERLDALRRAMIEHEDRASYELEVACLDPLELERGEFFALAAEAERRIDEAMTSAPGDPTLTRSVIELLAMLERYERDVEQCFADPKAFVGRTGGGARPVTHAGRVFWMHAGLEAIYDDHFLAYRDDVANLRVTDQLAERLVARAQLDSRPHLAGTPLPLDTQRSFARLRGEAAQTLYNGESQLSGPSGWAEGYFHVPVLDGDVFFYGIAEGGFERGWLDRGLPGQLIMPLGRYRSQLGLTAGARDALVPWLAAMLGSEGQFYVAPDPVSPARALSGDSPPTGAAPVFVPPELDDADRVSLDARARWAPWQEVDGGLFVDIGLRAWLYPHGMPTLHPDLRYGTREDAVAFHAPLEVGGWLDDSNFRLIGQIGATLSRYPQPHDVPLAAVSGRIYAEFAEGTRADDGGRLWSDVWRRVDDAPGLGDAQTHTGMRAGLAVWEHQPDGIFEFDLGVLIEHVSRELLVDESVLDASLFRAGFATAWIVSFEGFPSVALSYQLLGEQNLAREPFYLRSLGEEEERPLLRNVVMLSLYMAFGSTNIELLDDRSPEWGLPHLGDSAIPALWWWEP